MEVMVTDKGITLNSLQGGAGNPSMLSNVIGTTMKLDDLIRLLRDSALDIFPEDDSFCYTWETYYLKALMTCFEDCKNLLTILVQKKN